MIEGTPVEEDETVAEKAKSEHGLNEDGRNESIPSQPSASPYEKASASSSVGKMEGIASTAGEKLEAAVSLVREKVPLERTPKATVLVDGLKEAGSYLRNQGIFGAIEDAGILIRRYPVQSLLAGLCVGFFLAKMRVR